MIVLHGSVNTWRRSSIVFTIVVPAICLSGILAIPRKQSASTNPEITDSRSEDRGVFWQLTDIHHDGYQYSKFMEFHKILEKQSTGERPWALFKSAIDAMHEIQPDPDFIIWTGDSVGKGKGMSEEQLKFRAYSMLANMTSTLRKTFPSVPIYPVIGNNDLLQTFTKPFHVLNDSFYDELLTMAGWNSLIQSHDANLTFRKGGYYSIEIPSGLTILVFHSNLWHSWINRFTSVDLDPADPADQLQWLREQLWRAREKKEKVMIVGHAPPGALSHLTDLSFYTPDFNKRFVSILTDYADVIQAGFFGHEHVDVFRIVYTNGRPRIPLFVSPSIVAGRHHLAGKNNPALRLYTYDRRSKALLDFTQYYIPVSKQIYKWVVEYRATEAYQIPDMSAASLEKLVKKFLQPDSPHFRKYIVYNTVSYNTSASCSGSCKSNRICAMTNIVVDDYRKCSERNQSDIDRLGPEVDPNGTTTENVFLMVMVLLGFLVMLCHHRRHLFRTGSPMWESGIRRWRRCLGNDSVL